MCCSPRDDSSRDRLVDVHLFFGSAAMGVESDVRDLSERSQCGAVDCSRSNIGVSKIVHVFTKCSDKLGAGCTDVGSRVWEVRTTMLALPLHVVTFIVMVGAGVIDPADVPDSWTKGNSQCGSCALNVRVCGIVLALCFCRGSVGFCRQTLLKWPILPQLRHDCL